MFNKTDKIPERTLKKLSNIKLLFSIVQFFKLESKHILKTDPGKSTVLDFRKNLNGFFIKDALYFGPRIQIKNLLNHFISKHK